MGKESIRRRLRRQSQDMIEMARASLALGTSADEVADDTCTGLDGLPDDVKRKLIEKMEKGRAGTTGTE